MFKRGVCTPHQGRFICAFLLCRCAYTAARAAHWHAVLIYGVVLAVTGSPGCTVGCSVHGADVLGILS